MKVSWILTAASAMAVASVSPRFVQADSRPPVVRYDHNDRYRDDHRPDYNRNHYRDFDENIDIRDVPRDVMRTVEHERRGRRIESVQYVHRDGKFFYRFRIDDPHPRDRDVNIRVAPGGRLLSIQEAEQYDHSYRR
jgi:hypothetical protein